ncbi:MAG TPA: hypothetical protein VFP78_10075 [Solirubrobacteraceae bacterium]|nr:hypothetical protein [Solirubrobacteraceae bacterium]
MNEEFPERPALKGLDKFRFDMREVFIKAVPGQIADIEACLPTVRPEVIVAAPAMAGAANALTRNGSGPRGGSRAARVE